VAEAAAAAAQKAAAAIAEATAPENVAAAQQILEQRIAENYDGPKNYQEQTDQRPANVTDHPAKAAVEAFESPVTGELDEPWDVILDKATPDEGKWFVRKVKSTWHTILSAADIAAVLKDPDWKKTHHQRSLEAVYGLIKTAIEAEDAEVFGTTREETPA
jgi:hypothetical protein